MRGSIPEQQEPGPWLGLPKPLAVALAVLALAVVAGYTLAWDEAPVEASDSAGYFAVAHDLEDFTLASLHYRPPGYPMWLRLLGFVEHRATRRLVTAELALRMAGLWMLTVVLYRLGLGRRALLAFALVSCLPPYVEPAAYVLSENLTQFLLNAALAAILFWRWRRRYRYLVLAGAALAAAALTRPTYQLLAPALAAVLLLLPAVTGGGERPRRRAVLAAGALVALATAPVAGFALFNHLRFDRFTISPGNTAYSLSTKTVTVLERLPDDLADVREAMIAARDQHLVERGSSHRAGQYYPDARAAVAEVTGLGERELDELMLRIQLELIAAAPLSYAQHVAHSVASYWFPTAGRVAFGGSRLLHLSWVGFHFAVVGGFLLQLVVLGGLGAFELSRRLASRPRTFDRTPLLASQLTAYGIALTVIAYTLAVSCLVHQGEPRFRTPTETQIVFLCFLGGSIWLRLATSGVKELDAGSGP